jgi:hypothetical protein
MRWLTVNDEIYHYGVPGMKWGVRRDTRILANHRRNAAAGQLKEQYRSGTITKQQYKDSIRKVNLRKKNYLTNVENKFKNAKTREERTKLGKDISNTAVKEVPNITVKRGLAVVNQLFGTASIGGTAYTSLSLAAFNPAFAAAYIGAGVVSTAAEAGFRYVTRSILDKSS